MKLLKRMISGFIVAAILVTPMFFSTQANAATTSLINVGSTGTQVSELQSNLKVLGYYTNSNVTGYYGPITKYAVMRFQEANRLYVDGIAGSVTLERISSLTKSYYTVQSGDSLWTISLKYGTTVDKLKALNNLSVNEIRIGQVIRIAGTATAAPAAFLSESENVDLYWLSRIIEAEASGEPYQGKVAVGNVIMNRRASVDFPDTIKGVIFEYFKGIPQFSPVADGTIYNNPSQDSIRAAQEALNGSRPVGSATYFFNPDKASAPWIVNNKIYVTRIGDHVFYR